MTYTSVSREYLQKAFALAHRLSEDPNIPNGHRGQFRAIATLIWKAHGEEGAPPPGAGETLAEQFKAAGEPIAEIAAPPKPHKPSCQCGDCVLARILAIVAGYSAGPSGILTK